MTDELCGDVRLSAAERRRYLLNALRELRAAWGMGAPATSWRLRTDRADVRRKIAEGGSPWRVYSSAVLEQILPGLAPAGGLVCELGCGGGSHARFLDPGVTYVGIDIVRSPSWSDPRLPRRWFVQTSASLLGVGDQVADVVISLSTMEHVDDVRATARESARILREGSHALHIVPGVWSAFLYGPHGYRRFAPHDVRRFADEGFDVVRVWSLGGLGSFALHLIWIAGIETGRLLDWPLGLCGLPLRTRGLGPRVRRHVPLRLYRQLLRWALFLDRALPIMPAGYAFLLRRSGAR